MNDAEIFNITERLQKVEYLLPMQSAPAAQQLLQDQRRLLSEVVRLRTMMREMGFSVDEAPSAA